MLAKFKTIFAKLSDYPRLRILIIVAAVILTFAILMHLLSSHSGNNAAGIAPSRVQPVSENANAKKTAVSSTESTQYNQLANVSQKRQFQSQVSSGASVFQNPFGNDVSSASPSDESSTANSEIDTAAGGGSNSPGSANSNATPNGAPNTENTSSSDGSSNSPVSPQQFQKQQTQQQQQQAQQQEAANNPQLQQQINQLQQQLQQQTNQSAQVSQIQNSMTSAVGNLTSSWSIPVAATVQGEPAPAPAAGGPPTKGPVMIKAGTIIFGYLFYQLTVNKYGKIKPKTDI